MKRKRKFKVGDVVEGKRKGMVIVVIETSPFCSKEIINNFCQESKCRGEVFKGMGLGEERNFGKVGRYCAKNFKKCKPEAGG